MKALLIIGCCFAACPTAGFGAGDLFDRVDDALTWTALQDRVRMRVSGTLDLEGYTYQQPAPGLIYTDKNDLLNPRLTLFLDAQLGPRFYFFAQSRADHGFDPGDNRLQVRLDEYALRFTPWDNGSLNLQIGKFATVVGTWVQRHHSWDNPFITAPLPYESLTGIFDSAAAGTAATLLNWAGVRPAHYAGEGYFNQYRVPIIWGPSYASGASITGTLGKFDYAFELKNASLSSRPGSWDPGQTQWQHPTFSARVDFRPDERWQAGFSASTGSYLLPAAQPTLAPGQALDDYRETVLGQDLSFAWHHLQFWAECYEARFAIPRVGQAGLVAYYLEAKYKFTPQFSGALRWNQQLYGTITDGAGENVRWGRNLWRIDLAPSYRFTPQLALKLQYSLQGGSAGPHDLSSLVAAQFVMRF
jgi:hypothetical protein